MIELSTALSFFATALLLGYAPGPDIIFVLTQSALHGARAGLATMCGLVIGLCFHTALVSLGVAALIQASPIAFTLIKTAGACYLLWLARLAWKASAMQASEAKPAFTSYKKLFGRGIIMNISNPKVTMFFLALLPQFCKPDLGSVGWQCFQLGLIFMLATAVAFSSVSLLAGRIFARFNQTARGQMILNKACALIFVTMAVLLLVSSL